MTRKQKKERALLLFSLSFLIEGLDQVGLIDKKTKNINCDISEAEDYDDALVLSVYKKLKRLRPSFATEKISRFFFKRIKSLNDEVGQNCQPLLMGLIGVYFYQRFKKTNEFDLGINRDTIENIFKNLTENNNIDVSECTVDKTIKIIEAIYPDEKGLIEFYRLTNKFPFNIKTKDLK